MNLWAFDQLIVKMLRAAGYNERADAVARAASAGRGESRPARYELSDDDNNQASAPFQHHGASPLAEAADGARAASGPEVSGSERIAPAQSTASPGQQAASAADVGIVEADDGAGPLWHAGTAHDAASARDTDHATGHTQNHELGSALTSAEPEADHRMHAFNSADPLAGLYSSRLRDALEREAFGSASSIAQDSAIVARADSFAHRFEERSKSFGPYSVSIDISRTAQNARIAALNGEIPLFARGDPELDPAITRALGRSTSREPTTTPTRSPTEVSAQLLTASPPRVRDSGMER